MLGRFKWPIVVTAISLVVMAISIKQDFFSDESKPEQPQVKKTYQYEHSLDIHYSCVNGELWANAQTLGTIAPVEHYKGNQRIFCKWRPEFKDIIVLAPWRILGETMSLDEYLIERERYIADMIDMGLKKRQENKKKPATITDYLLEKSKEHNTAPDKNQSPDTISLSESPYWIRWS